VVEASPVEQQQEGEEVCSIQAHRVIVAARCDWFRRALLSGMREAIDRYLCTYMYISIYVVVIFLENTILHKNIYIK
jgi:hypothetical protein